MPLTLSGIIPALLFSLTFTSLQAQLTEHPLTPVFTSFIGPVYKMPVLKTKRGKGFSYGITEKYGEFVKDYKILMDIELETLDIPDSDCNDGFPGHPKLRTQYAMLLDSEVTIKETGCYQFKLKSDDGSILWIQDQKIVDNDGGHGMRTKIDSTVLNPGTYAATLWYFQGHANRFGLQFKSNYVGPPETCPVSKIDIRLDIKSEVFFETGSFEIKSTVKGEMNQLCNEIVASKPKKIEIIGHTDDIGTAHSNQLLSLKRAQTIASELKNCLDDFEVDYKAIGKGESAPLIENNSDESRSKNRRVEIIIKH